MDVIIPEQNTRNNIILAAYDLFLQQGFHGTSMRQIAFRAGISLSGLYNHFKNGKEEIFEAVFWQYHPYHEVIPILLETQGDSIVERVQRAAEKMVQAIRDCEESLGHEEKFVQKDENELRNFAQRGIQATTNISKGDLLLEGKNIDILRSGTQKKGSHPRFLNKINGKRASRDISLGDGVTLDDFE